MSPLTTDVTDDGAAGSSSPLPPSTEDGTRTDAAADPRSADERAVRADEGVAAAARLGYLPGLDGLRAVALLAALGYAANWRAAATTGDYARLFSDPSPVAHLWSLAIEELDLGAWAGSAELGAWLAHR